MWFSVDNYTPGDGSPVVELTALEDDPALREQYSKKLSSIPTETENVKDPRTSDTVEPTFETRSSLEPYICGYKEQQFFTVEDQRFSSQGLMLSFSWQYQV